VILLRTVDLVTSFIDIVLHLDTYLTELVSQYGVLTYAILFGIIFSETGLVVMPFLPGDSLLFAGGAIAALGSLNIWFMWGLLVVAAILGDTVNYWVGHFLGQKIVDSPKIKFINQDHIDKTQKFYEKHGGKTIILARFVPIIRTFAPFVAGIGRMNYSRFFAYNIVGGIIWITLFTFAGFFFGNIPVVQTNFHYVIVVIVLLSVLPMVFEYIKSKRGVVNIANEG